MDPSSTPPKKPMAFVRRIGLFRREIIERVSPAGLDLLLQTACRISEGQVSGDQYFGSTLLTLDLQQAEIQLQDACDVATAARLARLLEQEPVALEQIRALARAEAQRIACHPLRELELDVRIRVEGPRVFIDVDVEGIASLRARQS
jgi:hypothetical protein